MLLLPSIPLPLPALSAAAAVAAAVAHGSLLAVFFSMPKVF